MKDPSHCLTAELLHPVSHPETTVSPPIPSALLKPNTAALIEHGLEGKYPTRSGDTTSKVKIKDSVNTNTKIFCKIRHKHTNLNSTQPVLEYSSPLLTGHTTGKTNKQETKYILKAE